MSEKTAIISLTGMSCVNCAATIERSLGKLPGVSAAPVNFATEKVTVTFDPERISITALVENIRNAG